MPPTPLKKLYVAKSLEDLENASRVDSSIQSKNTAGLIGLADRIFTTAEVYYSEKDEEKAFIQYSKFVELLLILKQKPDFQKYPYHIKLSMNVNSAVKKSEQLKESLEKRYLYHDEDSGFENEDFSQFALQDNKAGILNHSSSESSNAQSLTSEGMEGPIVFNSDVRKEVFTFFTSILQNYSEPVYYEYIRGHVSKASFAVKKYVASKLKGEKFLDYFKLRKNYFTVEGTDVVLNKNSRPKRTRGRSECVTSETNRGRKPSLKRDKSRSKRSLSCSSAVSKNTSASSCISGNNIDKKLEHEDYVNKFFFDLIIRHEKVDIHSLEYDFLPKKVKRHLDLYYKRKAANYFAHFPDKYIIDDDWKVSFNLQFPKDSCMTTESKSDERDTQQKDYIVQAEVHSSGSDDKEIQSIICHTDAVLFFMDILTKKKPILTVQQLGGYVSQASKELKSYFKLNYINFKSFFEECPYIFVLNSCEEVTLSKLSLNHKSSYEDMRKAAHKASVGDISFKTFKERVKELKNKIETFPEEQSDELKENGDKVVAETPSTIQVNSNEKNCLDESLHDNVQSTAEEELRKSIACIKETESSKTRKDSGAQREIQDLSKMKLDVQDVISSTLSDYEYYGISSENIVFEINGELYEPTCEPFKGKSYFYEDELNAEDSFEAGKKRVVKIIPTPCARHKKYFTGGEDTVNLRSKWTKHIYKVNEESTYRFLVMVELFCLEMTEDDFDFTVSNEVGAIQHFIEVLNQPSRKTWSASNLHGTMGKASAEVTSYIRKKYNGDNFIHFFKKQPEFEVFPPIVKLSASYKETFARRSKALSVSVNRNSKWDLLKLFESSCYQKTLREVLSLLGDVCNFLLSRFKAKITRLEKIVKQYPICLNWIKALEGETMAKKTKLFFELFDIFDFPTGQYISFQENYYNVGLMKWFDNSFQYFDSPNPNFDLVSIFHNLNQAAKSPGSKLSNVIDKEYVAKFCNFLNEAIKDHTPLYYHELAGIIPGDLIEQFIKSGITSRNLIDGMLKDGQYFLTNCEINLKTTENNCDGLESAENNLFSDNEKLDSNEGTSDRSNKVISSAIVPNEQISKSNSQVNCANSAPCETILLNSLTPTCVKDSDIPSIISNCDTQNSQNSNESMNTVPLKDFTEKFNNTSIEKNTNDSSDVVNCLNNDVKRQRNLIDDFDSSIDEIESLIELGKRLSISENEELAHLGEEVNQNFIEINKSVSDASYLETHVASPLNVSEKENCEEFDSSIDEIESLIELGKRHSLSISENEELAHLGEEDNQNSIETNKSVSDASYRENRVASPLNVSEKENCEEFDSSIDEIEALIELGKRHSLSISENEELAHLGEDNQNSIETNKSVSDASILENRVASPLDVSEEENCDTKSVYLNYNDQNSIEKETNDVSDASYLDNSFSSHLNLSEGDNGETKSILLNHDEIAKYLELLKMDDVCTEDNANQNDACGDGKVSNETIVMSTVSLASNLSVSSAIELSEEHKVADVLDAIKSPADYSNVIENICDTKLTVNKDISDVDVQIEVASQDKLVSTNKASSQIYLNDGQDVFSGCPSLGDYSSTNDKDELASLSSNPDKECDSHSPVLNKDATEHNLESKEKLKSIDDLSVPNEYPLQPISADIVLLTADSCIAVAEVNSRKQNIYFLKCVFSCDNQYCCSDCFNLLKVGDIVSCFVPPTEIPRKMWVAFMVSKESCCYFNEINSFNETIMKQSKDSCMNRSMCVNSRTVSTETEYSSVELGCHSKPMANETSQTDVSGDIKLCAITKDSMCQMNTSVDFASTQTSSEVCSRECQTETIDTIDIESQTSPVQFKEIANCVENSCQTNLSGEVREIGNVTNSESQTISTGMVMITKYYHL